MAKFRYLKKPGYVCDLIYSFVLNFNKEVCLLEHVNRDKLYSDSDFFKSVINKFAPFNQELSPFFYLKNNGLDFITTKYFLTSNTENVEDFGFDTLILKLSDKQLFLANLSDYYFNDYNQYSLIETSQKINTLSIPDDVKHHLLAFYIAPEVYINKLINELKTKESILKRYYEENYEILMKIQSGIDAEFISEYFQTQGDTGNSDYSLCLLNKNLLNVLPLFDGRMYMLGADYQDSISFAKNSSLRPDMVKFGKIFSEENRIKVIEMICERNEMCTSDIAKNLSSSATVIYYHLEMMSDAKMLNARNEGRTVYYSLNKEYFKKVADDILKYVKD